MVRRVLVPLLVAFATFPTRARRVKQEYFPSVRAADSHFKPASISKRADHFTAAFTLIAKKLSANSLVAHGKEAFSEKGGGRDGEHRDELFWLMMWNKLFGKSGGAGEEEEADRVSAAAGEGSPAADVSARTGALTSKIAECLTKPIKKMGKKLKYPASFPVTDLVWYLNDISKKGGCLEQSGFAKVATQLLPNARKLSTCPAGYTVVQCLQHETVRFKNNTWKGADNLANTLAHGNQPAILEDPSPAMGFIWCMRIVGFIGEMFKAVARGKSLLVAAKQAYVSRMAPAFALWSPSGLVVKSLIMASLSEANFMSLVGGQEAGMVKISANVKADMMEFSQVVLPLVDGIWDTIVAHKLDDSQSS